MSKRLAWNEKAEGWKMVMRVMVGCAALLLSGGVMVRGQDTAHKEDAARTMPPTVVETITLSNTANQAEQNDLLTALRNILDIRDRLFLDPSTNVLAINAPAEQVALARRVIRELDMPRKAYRLTYTLTESDSGKRVGVQHFSMTMTDGQLNTMKQGSRIPISTAQPSAALTSPAQVTYIDVGLSFEATVTSVSGGAILKSKAEQSSVADERSNVGLPNPVIRQVMLEGVSSLALGKPLVLGSLDVPGSTRHVDVEVVLEMAK